jgi:hypothetical protein
VPGQADVDEVDDDTPPIHAARVQVSTATLGAGFPSCPIYAYYVRFITAYMLRFTCRTVPPRSHEVIQ